MPRQKKKGKSRAQKLADRLSRLRKGAAVWNGWRRRYRIRSLDLSEQEITHFVSDHQLHHHLAGPRQSPSPFQVFRTLQLEGVDLSACKLYGSVLRELYLQKASFRQADLRGARIIMARLDEADFSGADLRGADFHLCWADGAIWNGAKMGDTRFGFCSLRQPVELESAEIESPCHVDSFTISESGTALRPFLDRCGLATELLQLAVRLEKGREFRTSFLSFSFEDESFIRQLRGRMLASGAPCWFAHEDLRQPSSWLEERRLEIGLYRYVDSAEVIVITLSRSSSERPWVEKEVERGLSGWQRGKNALIILFLSAPSPAALPWIQRVEQHPVVDFRGWEDQNVFDRAFERLLKLLRRS